MSLAFTLIQLIYFAEVGRLENMTLAAEKLGITQPTLSGAIRQLETNLGVSLFMLTQQRRIRLTPAGRTLLNEIPPFLQQATHLNEKARDLRNEMTGELAIGVYSPIAPYRVPRILREFSERHPEVAIRFIDGNLATLQELLLDGSCDFAIMYNLGLDPRLQTTTLDRYSPYILLPHGHRLADEDGPPITLERLKGEPFILLDLPHAQEHYLSLFALSGVTPNVRYSADSYETVRSFVGSGLGYTILHQGQGQANTSTGAVTSRRIAGNPPKLEVVMAQSPDAGHTRRGRAFAQIAKTAFAKDEYPRSS